ncbi:MAG TPA: hypothetical protein VGQ76_17510 [Thermoanaerobaculia bacterium]|jgi:hypothetical protein|nr:hypothetical protein [Thermoanaerobaculia bacterium]
MIQHDEKPPASGDYGTRVSKALAILLVVALACPAFPALASPNPQFDITGVWKNPGGAVVQLFQEKDEVHGVYVNAGWAHRMSGRFVSPTKVKLIQIRRTRSNGCEMTMTLDLTVQSGNAISVASSASETACGLTAGQSFPDSLTRVQ